MRICLSLFALILAISTAGAVDVTQLDIPDHVATKPADRMNQGWWKQRHERFNEISQAGQAQLVFLGDSITQGWEGRGKEVWAQYYGDRQAANFGCSGDRTEHVLWRMAHGNFKGLQPKVVVIMIGTNNTGHKTSTPEQTADGIAAILKQLRTGHPETRILLMGVFPRSAQPGDAMRKQNVDINERIKAYADGKHIVFLDIADTFTEDDGSLPKTIMPDLLHLNRDGYTRWAEAIEPTLKNMLGE